MVGWAQSLQPAEYGVCGMDYNLGTILQCRRSSQPEVEAASCWQQGEQMSQRHRHPVRRRRFRAHHAAFVVLAVVVIIIFFNWMYRIW